MRIRRNRGTNVTQAGHQDHGAPQMAFALPGFGPSARPDTPRERLPSCGPVADPPVTQERPQANTSLPASPEPSAGSPAQGGACDDASNPPGEMGDLARHYMPSSLLIPPSSDQQAAGTCITPRRVTFNVLLQVAALVETWRDKAAASGGAAHEAHSAANRSGSTTGASRRRRAAAQSGTRSNPARPPTGPAGCPEVPLAQGEGEK